MARLTKRVIAATALLLTAACGGRDRTEGSANAGSGRMSGDSLVIQTTDGTMKLGLVHDTVFLGLTDSVLAVARTDMARDTEESSNAFARTLERYVKSKVSSALQMHLNYPLADVKGASYSNGMIKFSYRNRRKMGFEDVKRDGRKALASFSPDDAREFVATVNSAIRTVRGN